MQEHCIPWLPRADRRHELKGCVILPNNPARLPIARVLGRSLPFVYGVLDC